MEVLIPAGQGADWRASLERVAQTAPLPPFSPAIVAFVRDLSTSILTDPAFRAYPELMALAHWFRGARMQELQQAYEQRQGERVWLPRGVVLHFAPSNVDSIFVYSWFLAMLVGNINIVRLSRTRSEQTLKLLERINEALIRHPEVAARTLVVTYDHVAALTSALSAHCDVRVIWGGDETVLRLRAIPLPPHALELTFADRFSLAALDARSVQDTSDAGLDDLVSRFYNDAFWFDQMACSSPRLVIWVGDPAETKRAQERFWPALERHVAKMRPETVPAVGIRRMATAYAYAALGIATHLSTAGTDTPCVIDVETVDLRARTLHCGGGVFLQAKAPNLEAVRELVTRKDQTLAVFGFAAEELREFARTLIGRGIDRIVPVGQALSFGPVWDGYDLLASFTREIALTI